MSLTLSRLTRAQRAILRWLATGGQGLASENAHSARLHPVVYGTPDPIPSAHIAGLPYWRGTTINALWTAGWLASGGLFNGTHHLTVLSKAGRDALVARAGARRRPRRTQDRPTA